jgi:hypothetical protein
MNASAYKMPPSVAAQVASLPTLPMADIKALWRKLFGSAPTTHNRQFLERRLAYRLQEEAFRKVNPELLERNRRRIETLVETGKNQRRDHDYRPVAGTVLTREYRGVVHRVVATADGQYDFQGRFYGSLSMIAREITATRWSGPLFFGLKAPAAAKRPAKKKGARR